MNENVFLVTIDCLRYDRCGFNGHSQDTTPTLDQIAQNSLIYDNAFAPGTYTADSFPGILAGIQSDTVSYYSRPEWSAIPPSTQTLAGNLREAGYETIASISNPHLSENRGFDQGFDRFYNHRLEQRRNSTALEREQKTATLSDRVLEHAEGLWDQTPIQRRTVFQLPYLLYRYTQSFGEWPTLPAEMILTEFLQDIQSRRNADSPLFGWTHLMDLHEPIHPSVLSEAPFRVTAPKLRGLYWDSKRATQQYCPGYEYLYDCALRYIDTQLNDFVTALQEMGIWNESILIVTSDHGEALYDRGIYGHPFHYVFDELLHVPLLIHAPSVEPRRISQDFSLSWISDVIAELLDEPDVELPTRCCYQSCDDSQTTTVASDVITSSGYTIALRRDGKKYVKHFGDNPNQDMPLRQLLRPYLDGVTYQVSQDRRESYPLDQSEAPTELRQRAETHYKASQEITARSGDLDASTEDLLQDLGYM